MRALANGLLHGTLETMERRVPRQDDGAMAMRAVTQARRQTGSPDRTQALPTGEIPCHANPKPPGSRPGLIAGPERPKKDRAEMIKVGTMNTPNETDKV